MATGKLSVYNMAEMGVNTTRDPIHLDDGELTQAQNVQVDPAGQLGLVRKRDGWAKLNTAALAGQVTGIVALPLPDQSSFTRHFYAPIDDTIDPEGTSNTERTSTNGTTWTTITPGPAACAQLYKLGTFGNGVNYVSYACNWVGYNNKWYYPGNDYNPPSHAGATTTPTIHVWDGTTDYLFVRIPANPNIVGAGGGGIFSIVPYALNQLLVSTYDGNGATGQGRVLLFDVTTGTITQLGEQTNINFGAPINPFVWQGKIWVGTCVTNNSAGQVLWTRVGQSTWTSDLTMDAGRGVLNMVQFLGDLYIGTSAGFSGSGSMGKVKKRAASSGAWSDSDTIPGAASPTCYGPLIVTSDGLTLLAYYNDASGGVGSLKIRKTTDGASWSTDYDISGGTLGTAYTNAGIPVLDTNGDIFWVLTQGTGTNTGAILKRAQSNGAWSIVDNNAITLRGPIARISF